MTVRCAFYMPGKSRQCNAVVSYGKECCGNHLGCDEGDRVPCPFEPNNFIHRSKLASHLERCPKRLWRVEAEANAYFCEDVNAGSDSEVDMGDPSTSGRDQHDTGSGQCRAAARAAYASALGRSRFMDLIERIRAAHAQACSAPENVRVLCPDACKPYMQQDGSRPFSEKHGLQQASILGNMLAAGMVSDESIRSFIEFGSGKGYLSCMLGHCMRDDALLIMMDERGFKLTADRRMRHLNIQRLCCDIKDFRVSGLPGLNGSGWVAHGKHLCGAATDFTLRCCITDVACSDGKAADQTNGSAEAGRSKSLASCAVPASNGTSSASGLAGIAVATCCHHRCSWRHYVNKAFFEQIGFSPHEFELMSWMTGWALCGHEAPVGTIECVVSDAETGSPEEHEAPCTSDDAHGLPAPLNQPFQAHHAVSRAERILVGQMCKQLIDTGRLQWLEKHGFKADLVTYIESQTSGENKLLLAMPR